jgi:hypothetical protein
MNAADACLSCAGTIVWFSEIAMILHARHVAGRLSRRLNVLRRDKSLPRQ